MTLPMQQSVITNWSKSAYSPCYLVSVHNNAEVRGALEVARVERLCIIPHGAGHSYTDAALNSGGLVIDLRPMNHILDWDAERGIMRVEAGATLRDVLQVAWKSGWWPYTTPSTPDVTVGGCVAMNVNGKNALKCGPFGAHVLSIDVMLASGEICTFSPAGDGQLFQAFVGSLGLLGVLTSVTLQLQHIPSSYVIVRQRPTTSFNSMIEIFKEESQNTDFLEAWVDGFARGAQLGRGVVTCGSFSENSSYQEDLFRETSWTTPLADSLTRMAAFAARPVLMPLAYVASGMYSGIGQVRSKTDRFQALLPFTFWPEAASVGYHALFSQGIETIQLFLPEEHAARIFAQLLDYSQQQDCQPVWSIMKRHRADPFLLSYQVDGFSLELNYARTRSNASLLRRVAEHMIAVGIEAGGRFYFAKDHYQTADQYRLSVGDETVNTFLQLKERYDPGMLFQSDLFRRIFASSLK